MSETRRARIPPLAGASAPTGGRHGIEGHLGLAAGVVQRRHAPPGQPGRVGGDREEPDEVRVHAGEHEQQVGAVSVGNEPAAPVSRQPSAPPSVATQVHVGVGVKLHDEFAGVAELCVLGDDPSRAGEVSPNRLGLARGRVRAATGRWCSAGPARVSRR